MCAPKYIITPDNEYQGTNLAFQGAGAFDEPPPHPLDASSILLAGLEQSVDVER